MKRCSLSLVIIVAVYVVICGYSTSGSVSVSLTNDLTGDVAHRGQRVTFICTIVADDDVPVVITWRSIHYIGIRGDYLQLTSADPEGHSTTNSRNPTTVATLINSTRSNRVITAVSELQLTALARYPTSNVSCTANGHDSAINTFHVYPPVMLTHNLGDDAVAYNGQRVTFICTINIVAGRDNIIITWESAHYIGTGRGHNLRLNSSDPESHTARNSQNPTTVATLINSTRNSNRVITAVSELQLTASARYPTSTVSCRANGRRSIITFHVDPLVTLTYNLGDDEVAYDGQRVTLICTIIGGYHTVITWRSAHYIGVRGDYLQLSSTDPIGHNTTNSRNPTTVATLINSTHNSNGVITAVSELQLTASAQYPTSNVGCRANGGSFDTITFQTVLLTVGTTTVMAQSDDTPSASGASNTMPEPVHNSCESKPDTNFILIVIGNTAGVAFFILYGY